MVFGYMPSTGMAVVRVLGDDMKLEDIMSLLQSLKTPIYPAWIWNHKTFFNNKEYITTI